MLSNLQVLEVMGILQKCKRFSGTSGGSIVAMMLAINENAEQVKDFMMQAPVNDLMTGIILYCNVAKVNLTILYFICGDRLDFFETNVCFVSQ